MQVNGASGASQYAANTTKTAPNTADSGIMATQFMQILMAEITHQDPLEPMSNSEMLSQFSQLNSLQELQQIHAALNNVAASNQVSYLATLIGKTIKASTADGGTIEGVVAGVVTDKDKPQLLVGSDTVDLSDVLEIHGAAA